MASLEEAAHALLVQAACSQGGMLTEITLRFVGKETYGKAGRGGSTWWQEAPPEFGGRLLMIWDC